MSLRAEARPGLAKSKAPAEGLKLISDPLKPLQAPSCSAQTNCLKLEPSNLSWRMKGYCQALGQDFWLIFRIKLILFKSLAFFGQEKALRFTFIIVVFPFLLCNLEAASGRAKGS